MPNARAWFYSQSFVSSATALPQEPVSPVKQSWEYIAGAQVYLAESMTDSESQCVSDMPDRVQAWNDLAWLQSRLSFCKNTCQNENTDHNQIGTICGKLSLAFCQSCGLELCRKHLERKDGRSLCEHCAI